MDEIEESEEDQERVLTYRIFVPNVWEICAQLKGQIEHSKINNAKMVADVLDGMEDPKLRMKAMLEMLTNHKVGVQPIQARSEQLE